MGLVKVAAFNKEKMFSVCPFLSASRTLVYMHALFIMIEINFVCNLPTVGICRDIRQVF